MKKLFKLLAIEWFIVSCIVILPGCTHSDHELKHIMSLEASPGDRDKARTKLARAIKVVHAGDRAEGRKAFIQAIKSDPSWWRSYLEFSKFLVSIGNHELASEYLALMMKTPYEQKIYNAIFDAEELSKLRGQARFNEVLKRLQLKERQLAAKKLRAFGIEHDYQSLATLESFSLPQKQASLFNDSDLSYLRALTSLRRIELNNTRIDGRGLNFVSKLPALQAITILHSNFSDRGMSQFQTGFESLRSLIVEGGTFSDTGVAHLSRLSRMEEVMLSSRGRLTDISVVHLSKLARLRKLQLENASLTSKGTRILAKLERLEHLALPGSTVDDDSLRYLASSKNLTFLDLARTNVTASGVTRLLGVRTLGYLLLPESISKQQRATLRKIRPGIVLR